MAQQQRNTNKNVKNIILIYLINIKSKIGNDLRTKMRFLRNLKEKENISEQDEAEIRQLILGVE